MYRLYTKNAKEVTSLYLERFLFQAYLTLIFHKLTRITKWDALIRRQWQPLLIRLNIDLIFYKPGAWPAAGSRTPRYVALVNSKSIFLSTSSSAFTASGKGPRFRQKHLA